MNTSEQLREDHVQSQASQQQVLHQEAQKTVPDRTVAGTGQVTWNLNTAADQGGDGLSKMIEGFNRSLRGLQRELSQVIYRLGNGG